MPGQLQLARAIPSRPGSTVGPEHSATCSKNCESLEIDPSLHWGLAACGRLCVHWQCTLYEKDDSLLQGRWSDNQGESLLQKERGKFFLKKSRTKVQKSLLMRYVEGKKEGKKVDFFRPSG